MVWSCLALFSLFSFFVYTFFPNVLLFYDCRPNLLFILIRELPPRIEFNFVVFSVPCLGRCSLRGSFFLAPFPARSCILPFCSNSPDYFHFFRPRFFHFLPPFFAIPPFALLKGSGTRFCCCTPGPILQSLLFFVLLRFECLLSDVTTTSLPLSQWRNPLRCFPPTCCLVTSSISLGEDSPRPLLFVLFFLRDCISSTFPSVKLVPQTTLFFFAIDGQSGVPPPSP